jgi:hypothetical protein
MPFNEQAPNPNRPLEHLTDAELKQLTEDFQAQQRHFDNEFNEIMIEHARRYAERLRANAWS